jgi:hypothetical protein
VYKVRRKPWGLSGSPVIVIDPPAWCGAARTLCAGDVETPFLSGEAPSGDGIKVTKGAWQVPKWLAFVASQVVLGRDLVTGKQYSCVSASTMWTRGGFVPTDTTG